MWCVLGVWWREVCVCVCMNLCWRISFSRRVLWILGFMRIMRFWWWWCVRIFPGTRYTHYLLIMCRFVYSKVGIYNSTFCISSEIYIIQFQSLLLRMNWMLNINESTRYNCDHKMLTRISAVYLEIDCMFYYVIFIFSSLSLTHTFRLFVYFALFQHNPYVNSIWI